VIAYLGVDARKVHTVYLGSEPGLQPPTWDERVAARAKFGITADRPCILFVGALGHDRNKGFDTLWRAWRFLTTRRDWDGILVVAGSGRSLSSWKREIEAANAGNRVRLLGFVDEMAGLLAAADLLVSPVRYDAYGLNVQEALCRGVPALVSRRAGVTERFTAEMSDMVLADPEDVGEVVTRLLWWRQAMEAWRARTAGLGAQLRRHTWTDMAARIVSLAEGSDGSRGWPTGAPGETQIVWPGPNAS
jgi:glycosyltransferase involved in cell wall biosynthesis